MGKDRIIKMPFGDMIGVYRIDENARASFALVPSGMQDGFFDKGRVDPMVQISCTGDATSIGFCAGETRHNSALTSSLQFDSQSVSGTETQKTVTTVLRSPEGIRAEHIVTAAKDCRSIRVCTKIINETGAELTIEALSSVNVSGITPFTDDAAQGRLFLHRFRSRWSAEGRHERRSIEELLLEPSWADFGVRVEKFGALGSMPVRGFFPFAAIEDEMAGVIWALSCVCDASWQIEAVRIDRNLSLSAGLADYEYGHWRKTLQHGETFMSPEVYVTAATCDLATACDRLLDMQRERLLPSQRTETLPAILNEYCTTWGEPGEEIIAKMLPVISGWGFEYFVIDAGWYADDGGNWQDNMGDWRVSPKLFPNGMKSVVEKINEAGMKAGIWFELEVVGKDADARSETAHLLTRDGKIIVSGTRRFWDMRSEWVQTYLTEKVIAFLKENGFQYIKIDYNDTIGIGCDGAESIGEALRECILATKAFFKKIRREIPDIAIEVCASGGHRLEPGFMELADYLSFSDAHEEKEIPVIAADLQQLVLAQKSQIWAVLRKTDPLKRIAYSVCAGMYGVLCISGDVFDLSIEQARLAKEGVAFYKKVSPLIVNGFTKRFGRFQDSNRNLIGYQAGVRYGTDGRALLIVHFFTPDDGEKINVPLEGDYRIVETYEAGDHHAMITGRTFHIQFDEPHDAAAFLLTKI
ncbi:MAG: alpha-galactosidase [Lachnospiraceae bacterium]|nr:alpha-galactosidase [Lachnospiraceae bacterium]